MITLYLRYTINPNKLAEFFEYAAAEQIPIRESGGTILCYFLSTDFAGPTNEGLGLIDFPTLADYEICRTKLADHPLHKQNAAKPESTGAFLSIQRSLIRRVHSEEVSRP